jgi:fucose permease
MESAQITGFAVLCALLARYKTRESHCLALFALFPANFGFAVLGAGFPTLIAMNTANPSRPVMWLTSFVSMAMALTTLWWWSKLLLHDSIPEPALAPREELRIAPSQAWL